MREKGVLIMTYEQKVQLSKIYNTLRLIDTKGDSTILMGECLKELKALMLQLNETEEE